MKFSTLTYPIWLLAHILQNQTLLNFFYRIHKQENCLEFSNFKDPKIVHTDQLQNKCIDHLIYCKEPVLLKGYAKEHFEKFPITHKTIIECVGDQTEKIRYENNTPTDPILIRDILAQDSPYKNVTVASREVLNNRKLLKRINIESWLPTKKITLAPILNKVLFASKKDFNANLHMEGGRIFNIQMSGKKTWYLMSPQQSHLLEPKLTRSTIQFSNNIQSPDDLKKNLPSHANVFQCEVEAGDAIIVPPFFWHIIKNQEDSVSVAFQWLTFIRSYFESPFMNLFLFSARDTLALKKIERSKRDKQ